MPSLEVRVWRGAAVESVHRVSAAVVDAKGRTLAGFGNPRLVSFLRSAAKPFQAIPLIASGAADAFGLTEAEIAVAVGSHNGEDAHVRTVQSILTKIGRSVRDLKCPRREPYHKPTALRLAGSHNELHDNCSGKHSGMLVVCVHRGWDLPSYQSVDHPLQREIRGTVASVAGLRPEALKIGIDGCGVPTFALPVASAARAYAHLAKPESLKGHMGKALARVRDAMRLHPEMVAGEDRLDTRVMRATRGRVLVKAGAEAFYGGAILNRGLGFALKVEDGASRAVAPALLALLRSQRALSREEAALLVDLSAPVLKNDAGQETGRVEAVVGR